ncbi:MAG TPA: YbaN family protein [Proteiniphilum sp.]|nr:YbaN family protein [Proteiniphilum sp.]HPD87019.1 YbaN family protein [Proteiniphilum sp.]HPJ49732.1 YbaN family protein [Proteiniphilum sp.]HPR19246.1 YbaN family protein [Proteiniphilum sp.]
MNRNEIKEKVAPPQEAVATIPEKKVKLEIEKNRIRRGLYLTGGILALALAILGIAVPGLPVTPLALLSAFLFAKSSERLYNWLLSNRILGPRIRNYQRRKGVTRKGKLGIMLFMTVMVLFSSFVVIQIIPIRIVILSMGVIGMVVVWFFVPTALDDPAKVENEDETK